MLIIKYAGEKIGSTNINNVLLRAFNDISDSAKMTYNCLKSYAYGKKNWCNPSISRIAMDRGLTSKTIIEHIKELKKNKLITVSKTSGKRNKYKFNDLSLFKDELDVYIKKLHHKSKKKVIFEDIDNIDESVKNKLLLQYFEKIGDENMVKKLKEKIKNKNE